MSPFCWVMKRGQTTTFDTAKRIFRLFVAEDSMGQGKASAAFSMTWQSTVKRRSYQLFLAVAVAEWMRRGVCWEGTGAVVRWQDAQPVLTTVSNSCLVPVLLNTRIRLAQQL